jgi:hypothetical protein
VQVPAVIRSVTLLRNPPVPMIAPAKVFAVTEFAIQTKRPRRLAQVIVPVLLNAAMVFVRMQRTLLIVLRIVAARPVVEMNFARPMKQWIAVHKTAQEDVEMVFVVLMRTQTLVHLIVATMAVVQMELPRVVLGLHLRHPTAVMVHVTLMKLSTPVRRTAVNVKMVSVTARKQ